MSQKTFNKNIKTVRLGLMPPLTGVVGIYGEEIIRAAEIACQEVNETGGVLNRPLELIIEDDGSLPDSAVPAAEKLVDKHRCVAIIGNLLSNSRIAVAYRVADPRKIPYLNFSFHEGGIMSRYFFHLAALPNQQISKMIPFMAKRFGSRMFFSGNNYEWSRGSIDAAKRSLMSIGGEVVGEQYLPIGTDPDDMDTLISRVEASNPDVFVPYFAGRDQVELLTRFTKKGLKQKIAVVMGHYDENMASHLPSEVREGFYSCNTYFMSVKTRENEELLTRLSSYPGVNGIWPDGNGILTNFSEGAYLCVKAFALAANQAGSLDPEKLVDALETLSFSGPQGEVSIDRDTHHSTVNTYLTRCEPNGCFSIIEEFGASSPVIPDRYKHMGTRALSIPDEEVRLGARIIDYMTEGVNLVSVDSGNIIFANSGSEVLFGYDSGEMIGKNVSELISPDIHTPKVVTETINNQLYDTGVWKGELKYLARGGQAFWCSVSYSAFTHAEHGEVWMVVQKDISQQKKAEEDLEKLNSQLEILVQERTNELVQTREELVKKEKLAVLGQLTGSVNHELRNPLNVIRTSMYLLQGKCNELDSGVKILFERIDRNIHRCANIVDEMMEFSRAGNITMEPVLLDSWIQDVIPDLSLPDEVKLSTNFSAGNSPVAIDKEKFFRVLVNISDNACQALMDFQDKKDKRLLLTTQVKPSTVVITLEDNGPGVPKDNIKSVFDPLYSTKIYGVGLGLAIVKQIVEKHSGEIEIENISAAGGTRVIIKLPIFSSDLNSTS